MPKEKFKYQNTLEEYENCPPDYYKEEKVQAIRWVNKKNLANSFLPLNVLSNPPKGFDKSDEMCKSYGLSMFTTIEMACAKYKNLYRSKRMLSHTSFVSQKGDALAVLELEETDGCWGDVGKNGHFTFHEYETTDLSQKIIEIIELFDQYENFKE